MILQCLCQAIHTEDGWLSEAIVPHLAPNRIYPGWGMGIMCGFVYLCMQVLALPSRSPIWLFARPACFVGKWNSGLGYFSLKFVCPVPPMLVKVALFWPKWPLWRCGYHQHIRKIHVQLKAFDPYHLPPFHFVANVNSYNFLWQPQDIAQFINLLWPRAARLNILINIEFRTCLVCLCHKKAKSFWFNKNP